MPYGVPQCSGNQIPSNPSGSARSPSASAPCTHSQSGVVGGVLKSPAKTRSQSCEFWAPVPRLTFIDCSPSQNVQLFAQALIVFSSSRKRSSQVSGFAGTHVLRQLVVKVDGAAFAVRVGLGSGEAEGFHASLHRGHVREVLRQDGPPIGGTHRGVGPFRLRLSSFRVQLIHGDLEDALVRVIARVWPGAVAQRAGQALAHLEVRKDLPCGAALAKEVGGDRRAEEATSLVFAAGGGEPGLEYLVGGGFRWQLVRHTPCG